MAANSKKRLPMSAVRGLTAQNGGCLRAPDFPEEFMSKKKSKPHLLIVEARFYDDFADAMLEGATEALKEADATWDVVTVMGALEIPPAIAMALDAADDDGT